MRDLAAPETGARTNEGDAQPSIPSTDPEKTAAFVGRNCGGSQAQMRNVKKP